MKLDHFEPNPLPLKIHLTGFKENDDLTIMNTFRRGFRTEKGVYRELLTLVYKDNKTGIKHKEEIIDPMREYYIVKPEFRTNYNRLFIEKDKVGMCTSMNKTLGRNLASDLDLKDWYSNMITSGNKAEAKKIHMHPDVFMSDQNLEDHYRFWFDQMYTNEQCDITKAYFDIEVDGIDMEGDFPKLGECPVNAITVCFQDSKEVFTLLLRNPRNPLIAEFEDFISHEGTQDLHDFVYNYVSSQRANKYNPSLGLEGFKYSIAFFDEDKEINMIAAFFNLMNKYSPDFALAWNQAFDLPYLFERCKAFNVDPAIIASHPDFEYKYAEYYIDERSLNEPAERGDRATISSYVVYLDQMIQFASRRKGQTAFPSMKLDDIGEIIAGVNKLDYKNITTNITELPYKDYKTFVYYNVMDVIVQYCIESEVEDINYVFGKALVNNTRYDKVHRQTVYLANRGQKEFYNEGFIMGNNFNKYNPKPNEKFPGAFVSDPLKVSDYARMQVNGYPINLFENMDDFDLRKVA